MAKNVRLKRVAESGMWRARQLSRGSWKTENQFPGQRVSRPTHRHCVRAACRLEPEHERHLQPSKIADLGTSWL